MDVEGYKKENGYGLLPEDLAAIKVFVSASGLPEPSVLVCYGGGWHTYWISDKSLTESDWRPYADGLWARAQKYGLRASNARHS